MKKLLAPRFPLMRGESEKGWQADRRDQAAEPKGLAKSKSGSGFGRRNPRGASPNYEENAT